MKSLSRHAAVLLVAGLLLVLSAGAGATAALVITGKQIKDNTVTGKDIKNRSLAVKDLKRNAKVKLRGPRGATGATGATGPAGPAGSIGLQGLQGLPGLSGFTLVSDSVAVPPSLPLSPQTATATATCGAGQKALAATAAYGTLEAGLLSQVTRVNETTFKATGLNTVAGLLGQKLSLDVVCANVAG